MIKWDTEKIKSRMFGGKGTATSIYEVDATDTNEEIRKELVERYGLDEVYPGDSFLDGWSRIDETHISVTIRSWGCD